MAGKYSLFLYFKELEEKQSQLQTQEHSMLHFLIQISQIFLSSYFLSISNNRTAEKDPWNSKSIILHDYTFMTTSDSKPISLTRNVEHMIRRNLDW